jgi:FHA domain
MSELILTWVEDEITKSYNVGLTMARIGRDPARCDLVLAHPTISGLHVMIYFDSLKQSFWIRNMRESNPPMVNGQSLSKGERELKMNMAIALGQQILQITKIDIDAPITTQGNPHHAYGLKCPNLKCAKISPYERITLVCPWCGTSLAGAASSILSS